MASFDRSTPPGGEGKITLRLNTKGYHGDVTKKARVFSNDTTRSVQIISLKTRVKTPIYISPQSVYFNGQIGQNLQRVIQISAREEKPLKLTTDQFDLEGIISFKIKEIEAGKKYQLVFNADLTNPGSFRGALKLTTNYPKKPEIEIPVRGIVRKVIPTTKPIQNK